MHEAGMFVGCNVAGRPNDFDGDGPLERLVMRFVYVPHTAATDEAKNAEGLEEFAAGNRSLATVARGSSSLLRSARTDVHDCGGHFVIDGMRRCGGGCTGDRFLLVSRTR